MPPRALTYLRVVAPSPRLAKARLVCGAHSIPCALGAGGRCAIKREGDGATPIGIFALRLGRYRPDRLRRPHTGLTLRPLKPSDGWCDAPHDPRYNRLVSHPCRSSAERMWRDDQLYDIVIMLGYNDRPVRPGHGSAIFLHVARDGYKPTEGCIAVSRADLLRLLPQLTSRTRVIVP